MTDTSNYPASKLLSIHNVTIWQHYVFKILSAYPRVGTAIRSGIPFVIQKPSLNDFYPNSMIKIYPTTGTDLAADALSHAALQKAMLHYEKLDQARIDEEAKVSASPRKPR